MTMTTTPPDAAPAEWSAAAPDTPAPSAGTDRAPDPRPEIDGQEQEQKNDQEQPERGGFTDALMVIGAVVVSIGLLAVAFYGSFHAISAVAVSVHVSPSWLPPVMIDAGLAGFILLDLFYTRKGDPSALLRQAVRGFTLLTIVANAVAGWPNPVAVLLHVPAALGIWIITESVRGYLLRKMAGEQGNRYDPVPLARWILSPLPTFLLRRRMLLWGERSYDRALDIDITRRDLIDQCKALGRGWKKQVPANLRRQLRQGVRLETVGPRVEAIVAANSANVLGGQEAGQVSSRPERDAIGAGSPAPAREQDAGQEGAGERPDPDPTPPGGGREEQDAPAPGQEPVPAPVPDPAPKQDEAPEREQEPAYALSEAQRTIPTLIVAQAHDALEEPAVLTTQRELTRALLAHHDGRTRPVGNDLKTVLRVSRTPGDLYKYRAQWVADVTKTALDLMPHDPDAAWDALPAAVTSRPEAEQARAEWHDTHTNIRPLMRLEQ